MLTKEEREKIKATLLNQLDRLVKEAQEIREISQQIIRLELEEIAIQMLRVLMIGVDTNAGNKIDKKIQ